MANKKESKILYQLISSVTSKHPFNDVITAITKATGSALKKSVIDIPVQFGSGNIIVMNLEIGLDVIISNSSISNTIAINNNVEENEYFFLHFFEDVANSAFDKIIRSQHLATNAGVIWTSSFNNIAYKLLACNQQIVCIAIHKCWLNKTFAEAGITDKITGVCFENVNSVIDFVDAEYRLLLNDLFRFEVEPSLRNLFVKNRVLLLVEKFFTKQNRSINNISFNNKKLNDDLPRLIEVEALLTNSIYDSTPTIEELAKKAAMSATKLKSLFKDVFGMPIYEYYQNHRMQVAKNALLTNKFTVKEVGQQVGYHNISHFAVAFKKVHGILPGSLLGLR